MKFTLHRPVSMSQAIDLAAGYAGRCRYIAGGTDLVVQLRRGIRAYPEIIDLSGIAGLKQIEKHSTGYQIGALCTHKDIESHAGLQADFPALCKAARVVGGHQVRNIGTIGGNIANASPAADVAIALLGLGAIVKATGNGGTRSIGIDDFFLAPGKTILREDEIIQGIAIPKPSVSTDGGNRYATDFIKIGRRKAMEIAVASVAVLVNADADGKVLSARIALGAVGPKPLRAVKAEATLKGQHLAAAIIAEVAKIAGYEDCTPRTDVRASDQYRRKVIEGSVNRALTNISDALRG